MSTTDHSHTVQGAGLALGAAAVIALITLAPRRKDEQTDTRADDQTHTDPRSETPREPAFAGVRDRGENAPDARAHPTSGSVRTR